MYACKSPERVLHFGHLRQTLIPGTKPRRETACCPGNIDDLRLSSGAAASELQWRAFDNILALLEFALPVLWVLETFPPEASHHAICFVPSKVQSPVHRAHVVIPA